MKTYSKEELKTKAKYVFDKYPKVNKVAVTSDGNAFIADESDTHAKNHSKRNRYGKELKIEYFTRDDFENKTANTKSTGKTAEVLIAEINASETVEAVEAIVNLEKEGKSRKTVLDAATNRIKELSESKGGE